MRGLTGHEILSTEEIAELRALLSEEESHRVCMLASCLAAEVERSRALLKRIEWAGDGDHCPDCGWANPETREETEPDWIKFGHAPDCELAALIGSR